MPFVSKKQQKKCYAIKSTNPKSKWNCTEFSAKTNFKNLPEKKQNGKNKKK